jgi:DoxX
MMEARSTQPDTVQAAAYQAFWLLRAGFTVAPILFGVDKFFNWSVHWPDYLAGWINDIVPGTAQQFMYVVGAIEIAAGLIVLVAPRIGAPVVAAWLGGIVINLLTNNPPEYYDIALRDVGLMLGALTLARLAWAIPQTAAMPAARRREDRRHLHPAA